MIAPPDGGWTFPTILALSGRYERGEVHVDDYFGAVDAYTASQVQEQVATAVAVVTVRRRWWQRRRGEHTSSL